MSSVARKRQLVESKNDHKVKPVLKHPTKLKKPSIMSRYNNNILGSLLCGSWNYYLKNRINTWTFNVFTVSEQEIFYHFPVPMYLFLK